MHLKSEKIDNDSAGCGTWVTEKKKRCISSGKCTRNTASLIIRPLLVVWESLALQQGYKETLPP
ncbi:hypothetical protein DP116_12955 [Brasilonema bromeliae SPC951]|uniref:Uncharacterized protein n=1 Tax=Brasilonema bromeliae SPC951 TaxID=385972 RepID=A0ABX1P8H1_9CYAN|nr:hypothetical protein [Brasilonema bromeliae SPC951]